VAAYPSQSRKDGIGGVAKAVDGFSLKWVMQKRKREREKEREIEREKERP
jgi:hypothetical protein